jgi:hypothetical protein
MGFFVCQLRGPTSLKLFLHLCNTNLHITLRIGTWLSHNASDLQCGGPHITRGQGTNFSEGFHTLFLSRQANAGAVHELKPWRFPSTTSPIHYLFSINHLTRQSMSYWEYQRIKYIWNKEINNRSITFFLGITWQCHKHKSALYKQTAGTWPR